MDSNNRNSPTMRMLLIMTAALEVGAGLALILAPGPAIWLLLGATLDAPTGIVVSRIAGAALVSLGVACGLSRNDSSSPATTGLIAAMLLYNLAVAVQLAIAALGSGLQSLILWPGVGLHAVMAAWCVICLRPKLRS